METLFNKMPTYFNLSRPVNNGPLCQWAPYLTFLRLEDQIDFPLGISGFQRLHTARFREDLIKTSSIFEKNSWTELNENNFINTIIDKYEKNPQQNLVIKLLGQLGFYNEAIKYGNSVESKNNRSHLIKSILLTYMKIQSIGNSHHELHEMIKLSDSFTPVTINDFIWKFNLNLNIVVTASQSRLLENLYKYKYSCSELLKYISDSSEIINFSKNILTSRYYRAVSYYPFFERDNELLLEMAQLCEKHAYLAEPQNEIEQLLKMENIFPMLETTGRIYSFLGNQTELINRLTKIVTEIDPFDSKAWMQLGDVYYKDEQYFLAKHHYQKSIECKAPHMKLVYFKMGLTFEKLGDTEEAVSNYKTSLKYEPNGITPKQRIQALGIDV